MKESYKAIKEEYSRELNNIIRDNKRYLNMHKDSICTHKEILKKQGIKKVVIPKIKMVPRYKFSMDLDKNIGAPDDLVLRYVPYIEGVDKYEDITYYSDNSLTDPALDLKEELTERLIIKTLNELPQADIFAVKKCFEQKTVLSTAYPKVFEKLKELSEFTGLTIPKILQKWETNFDRNKTTLFNDNDSFFQYFCNICYFFDCHLHDPSNIQMAKCEPEYLSPACDNCTKKIKKETLINKEIEETMAHLVENYTTDPCTLSLFLQFIYENANLDCAMIQNWIEQRKLKTLEIRKKIIKKTVFKNTINPYGIYLPCNHRGSCHKNRSCECHINNRFCELSCFCEECDNLYVGCKCKVCDSSCTCMSFQRECAETCQCIKCKNNSMHLGLRKITHIGVSSIDGFGLFAGEPIKKGEFVIEYTGEFITNNEAERRGYFYEKRKVSYLFDVLKKDEDRCHTLDAMYVGSRAKYINHSKKPNLVARVIQVYGIKRIGFYALNDIQVDEELFFDYNYQEEYKQSHNIIE
ncbi:Histone-lysine N-methyltransferase EZH2 [Astathelohania contejeani]|uniref:Histone-lysine N-methyltransferase EZH2 n=1 Tax=Astathelohania contejeani TaxID=164912 RepID=A0ABQ7I0J8_9MICR|nr:Histone-lysine N-methyltransferase EZH2 [Thelohania contejeani]